MITFFIISYVDNLNPLLKATTPAIPSAPSGVVGQLKSAMSSWTLGWNNDTTQKSPILVALKSWVTQKLSNPPFTAIEGDLVVEESSRGEYLHKVRTGCFVKPPSLLDTEVVDYAVDLLVVMRYYKRSYKR